MPDARISELPLATSLGDTDIAPLVQASGVISETRRATLAQLRGAVLADRGAHVRDYGAKGDGTTDDGPAIQAAVNDLKAKGGGTLSFGPKVYRIASAVVLDGATVRLQGAGFTEGAGPGQGTWLRITSTGFTPFTFTGSNSRGAGIRDIAVQQTHGATLDGSWAPTAYDHVFRVEDCLGGVDFDNVFLGNVNRGIYCRNSGRLDIRRLRGQVFTTGIEIDQCYDIPRIHNVHFWTFWSANANVVAGSRPMATPWCSAAATASSSTRPSPSATAAWPASAVPAPGSPPNSTSARPMPISDIRRLGRSERHRGQIANLTSQNEIFDAAGPPIAGGSGIFVDASNTRVQAATCGSTRSRTMRSASTAAATGWTSSRCAASATTTATTAPPRSPRG